MNRKGKKEIIKIGTYKYTRIDGRWYYNGEELDAGYLEYEYQKKYSKWETMKETYRSTVFSIIDKMEEAHRKLSNRT